MSGLVGMIVLVIAACGSAPATASSGCGPRSARTLAADQVARVYQSSGNVYGCAGGARRGYLLAAAVSRLGEPRIGKLVLAGAVAAYAVTRSAIVTISAQITVRRLDTGRTLHQVDATTGPLSPESFQSVGSIVVKSDGAAAWIVKVGSILRHESETQVNRIDGRGEATLDGTLAGDIGSLRLRGSQLSWRHGGVTRTATLA